MAADRRKAAWIAIAVAAVGAFEGLRTVAYSDPVGIPTICFGETAGAALSAHPDVDKVAFTGSTAVGKRIQKSIAGTKKKITLELGGKAANIVFADAPIDQAIEGIVNGIYFNQGHVCCAGSRLLVEESVHDVVVRKLEDRLKTLRLGDPLDLVRRRRVRALARRLAEQLRDGRVRGDEEDARLGAELPHSQRERPQQSLGDRRRPFGIHTSYQKITADPCRG